MSDYRNSREIRIFISSTFKDMRAERDVLVSTVFPHLRQMAAERQVDLTDIDLRWGVSEKEARESKIVEICLEEIDKSHPFFIGILGERYGWIPGEKEINWSKILPEQYHDTLDHIQSGLSMTEIEITNGVLLSDGRVRGGFYLKDCDEEQIDPRQKRLRDLVRMQDKLPGRPYKTIEELAELITEDFEALLEELFPVGEAENLAIERLSRIAALEQRTKFYVRRLDVESEILSYIHSDEDIPCVITSASGMGKSATLSRIALDLLNDDEVDVIPVFISDMGHDTTMEDVAKTICEQIARIYELELDESNAPFDEINRLAKGLVPKRTMCIIVDGIDQLASEGLEKVDLSWWPKWNVGCKAVFSTADDSPILKDQLDQQTFEVHLNKMVLDQRLFLAEKYFEEYRKTVTPEIRNRLATDNPLLDNTLVFTTILDELRRYGDYDSFDTFIASLTSCESPSDLFNILLDNEESYFSLEGKETMLRKVFSLISLSRTGLTEPEMIQLTGASRLDISRILSLNSIHLTKHNGQIVFAHRLFEQSVQKRYLDDKNAVCVLRKFLADYFLKQESYPRRDMEIAYQFYKLEIMSQKVCPYR